MNIIEYNGPVNRTLDLSLVDLFADLMGKANGLKSQMFSVGARFHIDGNDNHNRRYWEYFWTINFGKVINPFAEILDAGCGIGFFQYLLLYVKI